MHLFVTRKIYKITKSKLKINKYNINISNNKVLLTLII